MQRDEKARVPALTAQLRDHLQSSLTAYSFVCKELARTSKTRVSWLSMLSIALDNQVFNFDKLVKAGRCCQR